MDGRELEHATLSLGGVHDVAEGDVELLEGEGAGGVDGLGGEGLKSVPEGETVLELNVSVASLGGVVDLELRNLSVLLDRVTDGLPLVGEVGGLAQGSIVVVGGGIGLVAVSVTIGASVEGKVGATDVHVVVDVTTHVEHLLHGFDDGLSRDGVVLLLPVVEPAGIELGVDEGIDLLVLSLHVVGLLGVASAEIDGHVDALDVTAGEGGVRVGIDGEEDGIVTEVLADLGGKVLHVDLVALVVEAVLVLDLDRDDASAIDVHVGLEDGEEDVVPGVDGVHVGLVVGTDDHALLLDEPVGKTTEVPFGTNVGTGSHDDGHVVLLSELEPAVDVGDALKVELALVGFVEIPSNVGLDGVEATGSHLSEDVLPAVGVDSEVVEGTGDVLEGLAILVEGLVADFKGALSGDAGDEEENEENGLHCRSIVRKSERTK